MNELSVINLFLLNNFAAIHMKCLNFCSWIIMSNNRSEINCSHFRSVRWINNPLIVEGRSLVSDVPYTRRVNKCDTWGSGTEPFLSMLGLSYFSRFRRLRVGHPQCPGRWPPTWWWVSEHACHGSGPAAYTMFPIATVPTNKPQTESYHERQN